MNLEMLRKIYHIIEVSYSGIVLRQGIDHQRAIILGYVPFVLVLFLLLENIFPLLGDRPYIHVIAIIIYCVFFIPNYLMPYARSLKIDLRQQKIIFIEDYLFQFSVPHAAWLTLAPSPRIYTFEVTELNCIYVQSYNTIQLLTHDQQLMFPDFVFKDIYEMTRTILKMYPLFEEVTVRVKPWEGNFANPYTYLERKLKNGNISFEVQKIKA